MASVSRRMFALAGGAAALAVAAPAVVRAQARADRSKVVFQITDPEPAKWGLVLTNVRNMQNALPGDDAPEVEVVVFGPGIAMLKSDSSATARVAETLATGVKIVACENTMKVMSLAKADMLPNIGYVPAGVVEVMRKQQQGYAYIRP